MDIGTISMRYAKALMQYALDTNTEDRFYEEMRMLAHSFATHPEMSRALENPLLNWRDKLQLITLATIGKEPVRRELGRFFSLIIKNHREELLHLISLAFIDLYRKHKHIAVARLTTAVPVTADMEQRIKDTAHRILHAEMQMETEVDPKIEGGFVFDVNGYRLDASIATQLRRVKQQFIDKNRRIV